MPHRDPIQWIENAVAHTSMSAITLSKGIACIITGVVQNKCLPSLVLMLICFYQYPTFAGNNGNQSSNIEWLYLLAAMYLSVNVLEEMRKMFQDIPVRRNPS